MQFFKMQASTRQFIPSINRGFLLQGRPGSGKSELIGYSLKQMGFVQTLPGETHPHHPFTFCKIDASLPDAMKKEAFKKAFHLGQMVWLDELNAAMDGKCTHWLNAFLSGFDPDTHQPADKPGFLLLVSINSAGMSGRDIICPSLHNKLASFSMPEISPEDLLAIIAEQQPKLNKSAQQNLAHDLYQLMNEDRQLTLRDITYHLTQYAQIYPSAANNPYGIFAPTRRQDSENNPSTFELNFTG
jgi:Cdc6-like AAA superfamily ATPase